MRHPYHCIVFACLLGPAIAQTFAPLTRPIWIANPSAFDTVRRRLVMLDVEGTVWELDGGELLPRTLESGAPRPIPLGHALCYDEARRRVLLFGGLSGVGGPGGQSVTNDTWAYDGSGWTRLTAGLAPAARSSAKLTWDSTRNRVVMWGGTDAASQFLNDTWEHDGSTWLQRSPATSPTPGRGTMVFDRQRSVAVLVIQPNLGPPTGQPAQTWEWNGTDWALRATLGNAGVDGTQTMAFDASRNRTVLAGTNDRIHEWDGASWTASPVLPQPFVRRVAASWFDPSCGCVILAGGIDPGTVAGWADRWRWDGQALTQVQPEAGPRASFGVLFADPPRGRMVHFGGNDYGVYSAATWALANGIWSAVPSLTGPSARIGAAATHDLLRGESLLFGGSGSGGLLGDTWSLGSAGWVARSTTGPQPRRHATMAADLVRGVIVLFGGEGLSLSLSDTWEWNGTLWTQRPTTVQPEPRFGAAMAFHPQLGKVMLFGGEGLAGPRNDTWTWDGSQWVQLSPATVPPLFPSPSMGTDLSRSRCTLIGATVIQQPTRHQVWTHDGTDWQRVLDEPSPIAPPFSTCANSARLDSMVCIRGDSPAAAVELTFTPGRVTTIGAGCGTPASTLMVRSRPRVGTATGFELVANPSRAMLFGLDLTSGNTPLGGCTVWLSPAFLGLFQISNASGFAAQPLFVPANPGLRGLDLFAQAAVLEPLSSNGLVLTQGLRLTLGD